MGGIRKKRVSRRQYIFRRIFVVLIVVIVFILLGLVSKFLISNIKEGNSYRAKYGLELTDAQIDIMRLELGIKETKFEWAGELENGNKPDKIIVHHAASRGKSVEEIHKAHIENGWTGIGYHYYIRSDGSIFSGRDENIMGAHAKDNNKNTLGVCVEGNFEDEIISDLQYNSLIKVIGYLSLKYPIDDILGHRDVKNTLCPGKNIDVLTIKRDLEKYIENYEEK